MMTISVTDLPLNVLTEILARLPLKTLLAAKYVCKTFFHLASSNPYLNALRSANPSPVLIFHFLHHDRPNPQLYLLDPQEELELKLRGASQILDVSSANPDEKARYCLWNSCNGLLLFSKKWSWNKTPIKWKKSTIMICEPITNEHIVIEDEDEDEDEEPGKRGNLAVRSLVLGFSSVSNRYKILKTCVPRPPYEEDDDVAAVLELGCGSRSWRVVPQLPDPNFRAYDWSIKEAFLDGVIYCLDGNAKHDSMGFFDFEREEFGRIKLPDDERTSLDWPDKFCHHNLGLLGGRVCLLYDYCNMSPGELVVWVLNKSGNTSNWTRNFVVRMMRSDNIIRPVQVMWNGEILIVSNCGDVACYNPKDASLRQLNVQSKDREGLLCNKVVNFIPNFVSLKNDLKIDSLVIVNKKRKRE